MARKHIPRPPRAKKKPNTGRRVVGLMVIFGVLTFVVLFGKLIEIMIVKQDFYEERAIANQTQDVAVSASRGTIYDAKGDRLAISSTVHNVILSPREVQEYELDRDLIVSGLTEILGVEREDLLNRLDKTQSAYQVIASKVEDDVADKVRQFSIDNKLTVALYLVEDSKRYYPYSSLAAQVVGFVDYKNDGSFGLESIYNDTLSGVNGRVVTAKNADGTEMLSSYEAYVDAEDGYNLNLTIDASIQYYAERTLQEGIQRFEVQNGGFCVVMDPDTGAVLAMASAPTYDLNDPDGIIDGQLAAQAQALQAQRDGGAITDEEYSAGLQRLYNTQWSSKALNEEYEPGSTFKPIVVASALEEGVVQESDTFYCSGVVKVDTWDIHCSARRGHGTQDLRHALMNSCNPALINIGNRLGNDNFYQYLEDFGFLEKTGIDMYNEGQNTVWSRSSFVSSITDIAVASFGQRFTVTPIQLVTAISAVINGGHLMTPYVVQSVTDPDGNVISYRDPQQVRQVISQETSDLVRSMMEDVVQSGTGKNARSASYSIGGKTGSSETGEEDRTIVSFVGFAPADDPQVVVLLALDAPKPASPGSNNIASGTYISGGAMAAPLAGQLITDILDYMGVSKQSDGSGGVQNATMPNISNPNQPLAEAQRVLGNRGLNYRLVGAGDIVTDQLPNAGTSIPQGSTVVLYMGEEKDTTQVPVPNVLGRTYSSAKAVLESAGLYINASGTDGTSATLAFSQSVSEGTMVNPGTVVDVRFTDSSVREEA